MVPRIRPSGQGKVDEIPIEIVLSWDEQGRFLAELSGGLKVNYGHDGTITWEQDPTGATRRLELARGRWGHLFVKPIINGERTGWFAIDTGATKVGPMEIRSVPLAASDMSGIGLGLDEPVMGLLGMTVLPHCVLEYDVANTRVAIHRSGKVRTARGRSSSARTRSSG